LWSIILPVAYTQDMEEVVVTGTRLEQAPEDVPGFVSVIIPEGEGNKEAMFESSPGMLVNSYGSFGDLLSPSIRGSTSGQVLILVDGMRLNDSSSPNLSLLSLMGVKRVEVLRGGGATLFGSDAVGGVINIITRDIAPQKGFTGEISYGSFDTFGTDISMNIPLKKTGFRADYSHFQSRGNFDYSYRNEDLVRENNGFKSDALFFKLSKPGRRGVEFMNRIEYQEKEVPGSYFTPTPQGYQKDLRENMHLMLRQSKQNATITFDSSMLYHHMLYYDEVFVNKEAPSKSGDVNTQSILKLDWQLGENLTSIASEFRTESINSSTAGSHLRSIWSSFLQDEMDIKEISLLFVPSIRIEYYSDYGFIQTARAGARFRPDRNYWLKANIASSFRMPTFLDLYWPEDAFAKGNPELIPEKGRDGDFGFGARTEFLEIETAYFHNSVKNLIQWQPGEGGKWSPTNVGRAEMQGAEAQVLIKYEVLEWGSSYTFLIARDLTRGFPSYGKRLIYKPEHMVNSNLKMNFQWIEFFFRLLFNSKRFTDVQNKTYLPGYSLFDTGFKLSLLKNFTLEFVIKNIFDRRYEEVPGYPQPGRNWTLSIDYKI